jgi:hypothetical protein
MSARTGPGEDDRRLPEGERRIGERLAGQLKSTTIDRDERARLAAQDEQYVRRSFLRMVDPEIVRLRRLLREVAT